MTDDHRPARPLPVRTRPAYPGGRHRRSDPVDLPPEAPALVIAVPGPAGGGVAAGLLEPVRAACPGVKVRLATVAGSAAETVPDLPSENRETPESGADTASSAAANSGSFAGDSTPEPADPTPEPGDSAAESDDPEGALAPEPEDPAGDPAPESGVPAPPLPEVLAELAEGRTVGSTTAIVVPLLTGPHPRLQEDIDAVAYSAGTHVAVTDPLGPHPMLAGALHEQLAAKGLARADRMRMLSLVTSTDGVIIVTVGGTEGAQAADMTAVLLASRLAVPVVPAALDGEPGVAAVASALREAGAERPAIAPCVIGPEAAPGVLEKIAADAGLEYAEPLGAHPAIARLIALRYEVALDDVNLG